ncbi:2OG-Fe(II) oxygenase family protein [Seonamhaeicola sp.]|uniref:2OG-Fe(II) oxygenase family protein n=1 Tax=Seonamhaeicola sp. TaxID=1912245 RepID=UPI002629285C|nr:2OG-Fe(II) oxygenase family protein [Seonamhaeicola sp.]
MLPEAFGLVETAYFKSSDSVLKKGFKAFLEKPEVYKRDYLQAHYKGAFDGYSYLGQKDSLNQYDTDLLHSFVLSEFSKKEDFPKAFHPFLTQEWDHLITRIRQVEWEIMDDLKIPGLRQFYEANIGHMVSCNYYPPVNESVSSELRLSKHVDVSLFTVFVFGVPEGFAHHNALGQKQVLKTVDNIIVFPGYLLEYLTKGAYKALGHQVDFTNKSLERFSFAFFSIPKPFQHLEFHGRQFTSEAYYQNYLSLF